MIVINLDVMMAKRKMSLTELADRLGMTMANVSNFKNHKAKAFRFSARFSTASRATCLNMYRGRVKKNEKA